MHIFIPGGEATDMADLVELTTGECWELLAGEEIARVALTTPVGPRILPVTFTVHARDLYFRTKPYTTLGTYGRDAQLAAEVDAIDRRTRTGWSVVLTGYGTMLDDAEEVRQVRAGWDPKPWPDGQRYLYIRLNVRDISGRRLVARHAPAAAMARPQLADGTVAADVSAPAEGCSRQQSASGGV